MSAGQHPNLGFGLERLRQASGNGNEFSTSSAGSAAMQPTVEQQFSDLLAEFTLPTDLVTSPEPSGVDGRAAIASPDNSTRFSMKPKSAATTAQGDTSGAQTSGATNGSTQEASKQLANAIAGMNAETQSQLLLALLAAQQQPGQDGSAQVQSQPQQQVPQAVHPKKQSSRASSSGHTPHASTSQPPSQHGSPMSHPPSNNQVPRSQPMHYATSNASSMPGSAATSPLASPYISSNPAQSPFFSTFPNGIQHHHHQQQPQTQAASTPHLGFVLAQIAQQNPQLLQQFGGPMGYPQVNPHQMQLAMEAIARTNPAFVANFAGMSPAQATNSSRSSADGWNEREQFGFSPATSVQSQMSPATSFPPSGSCPPLNTQGLNPSDVFYPLGSPAMVPTGYNGQDGLPWASTSLQGLVDQTRALAFDSSSIHGSPQPFSPSDMSPRMMPSGGSQRRGASANSKKTRPSPLLKPTPDGGAPLKRKTTKKAKRDSVAGSVGSTSAQSSPFMGPTSTIQPLTSSDGRMTGTPGKGSTDEYGGSQGSINTPSPVDLAMSDTSGRQVTSGQPTANGAMGPPAAPSSKKTSPAQPAQENWLNPATPGTFMNLSSDVTAAGLSVSPYMTSQAAGLPTFSAMPMHFGMSPEGMSPAVASPHNGAEGAKTTFGNGHLDSLEALVNAATAGHEGDPNDNADESQPTASSSTSASTVKPSAAKKGLAASSSTAAKKGRTGPSPRLRASDSKAGAAQARNGYEGADYRKSSHKVAEQRRRDSLKQCFEQLRRLLPPMLGTIDENDRRPGEGNVGGQRNQVFDPDNPNKGVSKAALLRRSNEYLEILHARIERRDHAIEVLRQKFDEIRSYTGALDPDPDVEALDLDAIDKDEKGPMSMAYYEGLNDSEDEREQTNARAASRRQSVSASVSDRPKRRTARYTGFDEGAEDDYDEMNLEE